MAAARGESVARPDVVAFDVNETLSDLTPLATLFVEAGLPADLRTAWFAATLRDGFALAAAGADAGFAEIAAETLRVLVHGRPDLRGPVEELVSSVLETFTSLDVHPDVPDGVRALADDGLRLVTLTNGAASIGRGLLERAGVGDLFEAYLSVEDAGRWKPAAQAYALAAERCRVSADRIALVAVHPWDIDGAKRAGLSAIWVSRDGGPYPSVFTRPDLVCRDLRDVAERVLALR